MIDPVNHARSPDAIAVYKTEPYVLASDVYSLAPHTGRGGWTWYTGAAGWMYRFILESLLGLRLEADKLYFAPCVPADWKSFQVRYRYRETAYHITVLQTSIADGGPRLMVDGLELPGPAIPMVDDRRQHVVEVKIHGEARPLRTRRNSAARDGRYTPEPEQAADALPEERQG